MHVNFMMMCNSMSSTFIGTTYFIDQMFSGNDFEYRSNYQPKQCSIADLSLSVALASL